MNATLTPILRLVMGATCSLAMCASALAVDEIERSCEGGYRLHLSTVNNAQGGWLYSIADVIGTGLDNRFSARRGCGRTVPNRCRQRAGEALMQCMQAHARNPAQIPAECKSNGVRDYAIANLEKFAQEKACAFVRDGRKINPGLLPPGYTIKLTVKAKVYGDEGCGGDDRRETGADLLPLTVKCTPD